MRQDLKVGAASYAYHDPTPYFVRRYRPSGMGASKRSQSEPGVVASNRRARHNFELERTYECGIVLVGSEVKSLRESKTTIAEAYARVQNDELWLFALHIGPYSQAGTAFAHPAERKRKLLVHRSQLEEMRGATDHDGRTLVPLKLYFKNGRVKVELALARRRRTRDKRQAIREREAQAEVRKMMNRRG